MNSYNNTSEIEAHSAPKPLSLATLSILPIGLALIAIACVVYSVNNPTELNATYKCWVSMTNKKYRY